MNEKTTKPVFENIRITDFDKEFPNVYVENSNLKQWVTEKEALLQVYEDVFKSGIFDREFASNMGGYSKAMNLSQPTDFYQQLSESRKLCGEPTTTRDNDVNSTVSTIMDVRKNAPTGYGMEILPKLDLNKLQSGTGVDDDEILDGITAYGKLSGNPSIADRADHLKQIRLKSQENDAPDDLLNKALKIKEVCDYWAANVNHPVFFKRDSGGIEFSRPIQPGLDNLRNKFHQAIHDGIVFIDITVEYWNIPRLGKYYLPSKIFFIDPMLLEPYLISRPKLDLLNQIKNNDFVFNVSDIGWRYRRDLSDKSKGRELKRDKYRRKHIIPIDMRDGQIFPVPFLIRRGAFAASQQIKALQNSDYKTALGIIRSLLLVRAGSEQLIKAFPNQIKLETLNNRATNLLNQIKSDGGVVNAFAALPGEGAEYIQPNTSALLSADKFQEPYRALLNSLGVMTIDYDFNGRPRSVLSPKPMLLDMLRNIRIEKRFWEQAVFQDIVIGLNAEFSGMKTPRIKPNPMSIFTSVEDYAFMRKLFDSGHVSSTDALSQLGLDAEAEAILREFEKRSGYDKSFTPRTTFQQGTSSDDKRKMNDRGEGGDTTDIQKQNRLSPDYGKNKDHDAGLMDTLTQPVGYKPNGNGNGKH